MKAGPADAGCRVCEREAAAEGLRNCEARFRRLFEAAREGLLILDASTGTVVDANPCLLDMLGCTCADLSGRRVWELDFFQAVAASEAGFGELRAQRTSSREEMPLQTADGRRIAVEFLSNVYPVNEHAVLQCTMRDLTGQLIREQVRQARKVEVVCHRAGGVAHDVNNLMQVMLGFCDLLLASTPESDPRHRHLVELEKAGRRASELARSLLQADARQDLAPRPTDVNELLLEMHAMLQHAAGEDVTIEFDLASGLERVMADQGQIGRILLNLAVNARDAMPHGGRLIFSSAMRPSCAADHDATPSLRVGRFVCISAADSGVGMPPAVLRQVFHPLFTTKAPGKGTGMGLSTAYRIARQHGGWMDAESEPGSGSTFRLYLPVAERPPGG